MKADMVYRRRRITPQAGIREKGITTMAGRRCKEKLDYFSLDVDYYDDPKFVRLRTQFGVLGEIIVIRLYCEIYHNKYYAEWNENLQYALADKTSLKPSLISEVVAAAARYGIFDETMFKEHSVLTSTGIQHRWRTVNSRRKKPPAEYWLLPIDVDNNSISVDINGNNVDSNATKSNQSKVKDDDENDNRCWKQQPHSSFSKKRQRAVTRFQERFCILSNGDPDTVMLDEFMDMITEFDDDTLYTAINRVVEHKPKYPVRYAQTACYQVREELRKDRANEV